LLEGIRRSAERAGSADTAAIKAVANVPPAAPATPPDATLWRPFTIAAMLAMVAIAGAGAIFLASHGTVPHQSASSDTATQASPNNYWRSPAIREAASSPIPKGIIPIAVLPLTALGDADGSTQMIADMMTDDLINILSRVPSLRVISRQTMNRCRDQSTDV